MEDQSVDVGISFAGMTMRAIVYSSDVLYDIQKFLWSFYFSPSFTPLPQGSWEVMIEKMTFLKNPHGNCLYVSTGGEGNKITISIIENIDDTIFWVPDEVQINFDYRKKRVHITVINEKAASKWGHKVIRQIFLHESKLMGACMMHSAALRIGRKSLLIPGFKGSGKTSLLVSLMRLCEASYVSNDRVILGTTGHTSEVVCWPYPSTFRVARGTMSAFMTESEIEAMNLRFQNRLVEVNGVEIRESKFNAAPEMFSRNQRSTFMIPSIVILPKLCIGKTSSELIEFRSDELSSILRTTSMFQESADWLPYFFSYNDDKYEYNIDVVIQNLAKSVRYFKFDWSGSPRDAEKAIELLQ